VKNTCPVSKDRLTDLYWKEQKTTKEIGIFLAEAIARPKPYHNVTVRRWLLLFGIPARTQSASLKLAYAKNPNMTINGHKARAKNCKARRVHLVCAHPDCRKKYDRRPSVAHQGKLNFCSYSCSTSYRHKARRERIALEKRFDALQQPSSPSPSAGYTFEEIARRERSE